MLGLRLGISGQDVVLFWRVKLLPGRNAFGIGRANKKRIVLTVCDPLFCGGAFGQVGFYPGPPINSGKCPAAGGRGWMIVVFLFAWGNG